MSVAPPELTEASVGGRPIVVVRDDFIVGGTKRRALDGLVAPGREYVYAGPPEGYAQVALAACCFLRDARATIFLAARAREHRNTQQARGYGARIVPIRPGYLTVVEARARAYAAATGATLLPFGFDTEQVREKLAAAGRLVAQQIDPPEVWTVAGSGVLSRALQAAFPHAAFHAVQIGRRLRPGDAGRATVHVAPEQFRQDAQAPPPFPSCANYDAKAWRFIRARAQPDALFWNVAA